MANYLNNNYNIINNNYSNPQDINYYKDIIIDSFNLLDNSFIVFNSINNIIYLIYINKNKSIISFDLVNNKKISEIKNAHNKYITNFRYYLDKNTKIEYFISISSKDNNIKLWNVENLVCLCDIQSIYNEGGLSSACFLNDNNKNYIISSNDNYYIYKLDYSNESIKVYDFKGNIIKKIYNSEYPTFFIDSYYDKKLNKNFIIIGNKGNVKSYDYNKNEIYIVIIIIMNYIQVLLLMNIMII